jgi:hypothetical protein
MSCGFSCHSAELDLNLVQLLHCQTDDVVIVETDYRGFRIEAIAVDANGVWDAEVGIRRKKSETKTRVRHGLASREHVHGLRRAAGTHAIGGARMTSSPAAARDRMIGHEGSNSERRTLNLGDRGWA